MIVMKLVIAATNKVAIGHQQHTTGSGVHHDKRLKRVRTRSQQKQIVKKLDTKY